MLYIAPLAPLEGMTRVLMPVTVHRSPFTGFGVHYSLEGYTIQSQSQGALGISIGTLSEGGEVLSGREHLISWRQNQVSAVAVILVGLLQSGRQLLHL